MWLPTISVFVVSLACFTIRAGSFIAQSPLNSNSNVNTNTNTNSSSSSSDKHRYISQSLYDELDELARVVDVAYCVTLGGAGIRRPFQCFSRCDNFPSFELVTTWNTGPLLSDSSGYIAVSHAPAAPRVLVVFRGTYSISNAIVDLSTVPQPYVPYPGGDHGANDYTDKCTNCTVHSGFYASWLLTRPTIRPLVRAALAQNPGYKLVLIGHSLGGAVAALGALEFHSIGYKPQVTTFGEPRIGNDAFARYLDDAFHLDEPSTSTGDDTKSSFRRVTHIGDPIPLLPLAEWGYRTHAGEVFIEKTDLPMLTNNVRHCEGDADESCIAGTSSVSKSTGFLFKHVRRVHAMISCVGRSWWDGDGEGMVTIPARFRLWNVLLAHRDYFYRLGLCVPGGDPTGSWGSGR